jgi:hypothetical protein
MAIAVFATSSSSKERTDDFWVEKWKKMDTPWRALEREVGSPIFPNPMFQVLCIVSQFEAVRV